MVSYTNDRQHHHGPVKARNGGIMRTRRSWKNQDRLFAYLFKPEQPKPVVKPKRLRTKTRVTIGAQQPAVRADYVPHYHQDDSGIFECELGSACRYKEHEPAGFEKPSAEAIALSLAV